MESRCVARSIDILSATFNHCVAVTVLAGPENCPELQN